MLLHKAAICKAYNHLKFALNEFNYLMFAAFIRLFAVDRKAHNYRKFVRLNSPRSSACSHAHAKNLRRLHVGILLGHWPHVTKNIRN